MLWPPVLVSARWCAIWSGVRVSARALCPWKGQHGTVSMGWIRGRVGGMRGPVNECILCQDNVQVLSVDTEREREGEGEGERESFVRNNVHNGVVSGAARCIYKIRFRPVRHLRLCRSHAPPIPAFRHREPS